MGMLLGLGTVGVTGHIHQRGIGLVRWHMSTVPGCHTPPVLVHIDRQGSGLVRQEGSAPVSGNWRRNRDMSRQGNEQRDEMDRQMTWGYTSQCQWRKSHQDKEWGRTTGR
jgi:hypothetical protein